MFIVKRVVYKEKNQAGSGCKNCITKRLKDNKYYKITSYQMLRRKERGQFYCKLCQMHVLCRKLSPMHEVSMQKLLNESMKAHSRVTLIRTIERIDIRREQLRIGQRCIGKIEKDMRSYIGRIISLPDSEDEEMDLEEMDEKDIEEQEEETAPIMESKFSEEERAQLIEEAIEEVDEAPATQKVKCSEINKDLDMVLKKEMSPEEEREMMVLEGCDQALLDHLYQAAEQFTEVWDDYCVTRSKEEEEKEQKLEEIMQYLQE